MAVAGSDRVMWARTQLCCWVRRGGGVAQTQVVEPALFANSASMSESNVRISLSMTKSLLLIAYTSGLSLFVNLTIQAGAK